MARNYYPRLYKYHLKLIEKMIDGDTITADDKKLGILRREYIKDFLVGMQTIGSECMLKDKLYFCEHKGRTDYQPVYPFFVIDWDEMRKQGVPVLDRQTSTLIIPLCYSCTVLGFNMKTKYFREITKGRWDSFSLIWESSRSLFESTFEPLISQADSYIRSLGTAQTEIIELGGLVTRIGLEDYYKEGKLSITRLIPSADYVPLYFKNR